MVTRCFHPQVNCLLSGRKLRFFLPCLLNVPVPFSVLLDVVSCAAPHLRAGDRAAVLIFSLLFFLLPRIFEVVVESLSPADRPARK